ncbi:hypothetical protein AHF37_05285 [Paragonimus kellicotti]|nr:hypothetical protein AHF37_05285 [Paragonimus kellicotti]
MGNDDENNDEDSSSGTKYLDSFQNKMTTADAIFPTTLRRLSLEKDSLVNKDVYHELPESPIEPAVLRPQAAVLQQPEESLANQTVVSPVCALPADLSATQSTNNNSVKDSHQNGEGSSLQAADRQAETTAGSWSSWIPRGFSFWNNDHEKDISVAVLSERSNELQLAALDQNLGCDEQPVAKAEQLSELEVMDKTLSLNLGATGRMVVSSKLAANQQEDEQVAPDLPQNSPGHGDIAPYSVKAYTQANLAQTNALSNSSDVQVSIRYFAGVH